MIFTGPILDSEKYETNRCDEHNERYCCLEPKYVRGQALLVYGEGLP